MSKQTIAYLAGHFDGEGTIYMTSSRRPSGAKHNNQVYSINVCVRGYYRPTLEIYKQQFGGTVIEIRCARTKKALFSWSPQRIENTYLFLEKITPLLMEKSEQAKIALGYLKERIKYKIKGRNSEEVEAYLGRISLEANNHIKSLKL